MQTEPLRLHPPLVKGVFEILRNVFQKQRFAESFIPDFLKKNSQWGARDRHFVAETSYDCIRWWRLFEHFNGGETDYSDESLAKFLGFSLSWFNKAESVSGYPVEIMPRNQLLPKFESAAKAIQLSIPDWLYLYGRQEVGEIWDREMEASNIPASLYIRVNRRLCSPEKVMDGLRDSGFVCEEIPDVPNCVKVSGKGSLSGHALFKDGAFEIQDRGSQLIAPFLDVKPGMRVIDACAGAGGKTLHLNALTEDKGRVTAMDTDRNKIEALKIRARRAKASNIEPVLIDNPEAIQKRMSTCDRLLLDVPCSGSGVIRRNPDTKWKLLKDDVDRLLFQQAHILHSYAPMVKPGGKIVYATCSLFRSENKHQVEQFLSSHREFSLEMERSVFPSEGGDGFYMARMIRKS